MSSRAGGADRPPPSGITTLPIRHHPPGEGPDRERGPRTAGEGCVRCARFKTFGPAGKAPTHRGRTLDGLCLFEPPERLIFLCTDPRVFADAVSPHRTSRT